MSWSADNTLRVWDWSGGIWRVTFLQHSGSVRCMVRSKKEQGIDSGSVNGMLDASDYQKGGWEQKYMIAPYGWSLNVVMSADGLRIGTRMLDLSENEEQFVYFHIDGKECVQEELVELSIHQPRSHD